jgi:hypothetical protein
MEIYAMTKQDEHYEDFEVDLPGEVYDVEDLDKLKQSTKEKSPTEEEINNRNFWKQLAVDIGEDDLIF